MNCDDFNLEIKNSKIHGQGLFTKVAIKKNWMICPFVGVEMQYKDFVAKYGTDLRGVYRRMPWQKWIVCKETRNLVSWVNDGVHNQDIPFFNCKLKKGALYSIVDISQGDELLLSYGDRYWKNIDKKN